MQIYKLAANPGPDIYYDEKFRTVLEDHLNWIKKQEGMRTVDVSYLEREKYRGDLFGLFHEKLIPREYHWLIMRLNNLTTPHDVPENMDVFYVPDYNLIERIRTGHMTQRRMKN